MHRFSRSTRLRWLALWGALLGCRTPAPGTVVESTSRFPSDTSGLAMVAPGIISTDAPEFAFTLSPDGKEIFFNRASADRSTLTIMVSTWRNGRWSRPVVAPFSGRYRDVDPFMTVDGKRLYFTSNRPTSPSATGSFDTWYVERASSGWNEPVNPGPPLNSDSAEFFVTGSRGGTLVFSSNRSGGQRIFASSAVAGRWTEPRAISYGATSEGVGNPAISPSGRFMLVTKEVPGRHTDIFFSCRISQEWGPLESLSPLVNSAYSDFAPAIDPGETAVFFTSERPGLVGAQPDSVRPPGDLYRVSLSQAGVNCQ